MLGNWKISEVIQQLEVFLPENTTYFCHGNENRRGQISVHFNHEDKRVFWQINYNAGTYSLRDCNIVSEDYVGYNFVDFEKLISRFRKLLKLDEDDSI